MKGQFLGRKGAGQGHAWTCCAVDMLKVTQQGAEPAYGVDANRGVLDWVHNGQLAACD